MLSYRQPYRQQKKSQNGIIPVLTVISIITFLLITTIFLERSYITFVREARWLEAENKELKMENEKLQVELSYLQSQQRNIWERMEKWFNEWNVEEIELTGYAPLDSRAIQGMCYSGDPEITSSGNPVVIGETAAAGEDLPFGGKIWIKDYGFRTITDRGSNVNRNKEGVRQIDIAVGTREEALEIGRKSTLAMVKNNKKRGKN